MHITGSDLWLRDLVTNKRNGAETEENGKKHARNKAQGSKNKSMDKI
jgi:hypothetical protein